MNEIDVDILARRIVGTLTRFDPHDEAHPDPVAWVRNRILDLVRPLSSRIKTCKTCRWYLSYGPGEGGSCENPKIDQNRGRDDDFDEVPVDGIMIMNVVAAGAMIVRVGPDFGCIHHEGKKP